MALLISCKILCKVCCEHCAPAMSWEWNELLGLQFAGKERAAWGLNEHCLASEVSEPGQSTRRCPQEQMYIPSRKARSAFTSHYGVKAAARLNVWVVFYSLAFHWGWNWLSQTIPLRNLLYLWSGGLFALWRVFLSGLPWRLECYHYFRSGFSALGQPCQFSQAGKIGRKLMPSPPTHWQTLSIFIFLVFFLRHLGDAGAAVRTRSTSTVISLSEDFPSSFNHWFWHLYLGAFSCLSVV